VKRAFNLKFEMMKRWGDKGGIILSRKRANELKKEIEKLQNETKEKAENDELNDVICSDLNEIDIKLRKGMKRGIKK
jgi:CobQ-like glutamine amidotransferase family enzyme